MLKGLRMCVALALTHVVVYTDCDELIEDLKKLELTGFTHKPGLYDILAFKTHMKLKLVKVPKEVNTCADKLANMAYGFVLQKDMSTEIFMPKKFAPRRILKMLKKNTSGFMYLIYTKK